jgi:hypothetical protein
MQQGSPAIAKFFALDKQSIWLHAKKEEFKT